MHDSGLAREGDVVLLLSSDRKRYLVRLAPGEVLHTHRGFLPHDEIIGAALGRVVRTQLGRRFLVLEPSLDDLIRLMKRVTQIMYPKDIGYILMKMNLNPGKRVIEAGTGSGGLALALATHVRPGGRVYSYDSREDAVRMAQRNLATLGLLDYVELKQRDIQDGFDEREVDACFLDVRAPWLYLEQVTAALKGGGFFGSVLPTTNQVSRLLVELERQGFYLPEVEEIMLRGYKATAARFRPMDRMIAHTGYLVFARKVLAGPSELDEGEAS
ncbi:MAG: tRNA (adenine-N1)-methyltransferase, partial [Chloroflexi bacterium]|nr:tRNA (adenine-N1)-methyltransferase [Chloroflexota bacterium]